MFGSDYKCDGLGDANCTANSQCKISKDWYSKGYQCLCNDEHYRIGDDCRGIEHVGVGEECITPETGPLKFCDLKFNMSCQSNICQCIRDYYIDNGGSVCISREEYIDKYRSNITVKMYEPCNNQSNGLPILCDEAANMTCTDSKCQCKKKFYYNMYNRGNETVSSCETKEFYVAEYNLTSYKGMVDMYCHSRYDCIDGLTCHNYKCSCPYPCQYEAKSMSCDCGEVSPYEGAGKPILIGIIGGIIIIAGWLYLIKKQIRKAKGPEYTSASINGDSNQNNSNSSRYPLQPTTTNVPITGGFASQPTSNSSTIPYRIQTTTGQPDASSSRSSTAAIPEKTTLPKSDMSSSPYNPNPSYPTSNSDLPPAYDSLYAASTAPSTSAAAAPLPYSLAPSYQTAPPTGFATAPIPYPEAPSYPTAPPTAPASAPFSYPPTAPATAPFPYPSTSPAAGSVQYSAASSNPAALASSSSDVPSDAPPPQTDIYQPIIL